MQIMILRNFFTMCVTSSVGLLSAVIVVLVVTTAHAFTHDGGSYGGGLPANYAQPFEYEGGIPHPGLPGMGFGSISYDGDGGGVGLYGGDSTCNCLRWTNFISADTPGDSGDWETLGPPDSRGRPGTIHHVRPDICTVPVRVECRTVQEHIPWYLTYEKLTYPCNAGLGGLACENKKQANYKKCADYEVRVLCFYGYNCPCLYWTDWYNKDTPIHKGDEELIGRTLPKYVCQGGHQPVDVQCKTATGMDVFHAGNRKVKCDLEGLACYNSDQGSNCKCHDYQVRFLCPRFPSTYPIPKQDYVNDHNDTYEHPSGYVGGGGETVYDDDDYRVHGAAATAGAAAGSRYDDNEYKGSGAATYADDEYGKGGGEQDLHYKGFGGGYYGEGLNENFLGNVNGPGPVLGGPHSLDESNDTYASGGGYRGGSGPYRHKPTPYSGGSGDKGHYSGGGGRDHGQYTGAQGHYGGAGDHQRGPYPGRPPMPPKHSGHHRVPPSAGQYGIKPDQRPYRPTGHGAPGGGGSSSSSSSGPYDGTVPYNTSAISYPSHGYVADRVPHPGHVRPSRPVGGGSGYGDDYGKGHVATAAEPYHGAEESAVEYKEEGVSEGGAVEDGYGETADGYTGAVEESEDSGTYGGGDGGGGGASYDADGHGAAAAAGYDDGGVSDAEEVFVNQGTYGEGTNYTSGVDSGYGDDDKGVVVVDDAYAREEEAASDVVVVDDQSGYDEGPAPAAVVAVDYSRPHDGAYDEGREEVVHEPVGVGSGSGYKDTEDESFKEGVAAAVVSAISGGALGGYHGGGAYNASGYDATGPYGGRPHHYGSGGPHGSHGPQGRPYDRPHEGPPPQSSPYGPGGQHRPPLPAQTGPHKAGGGGGSPYDGHDVPYSGTGGPYMGPDDDDHGGPYHGSRGGHYGGAYNDTRYNDTAYGSGSGHSHQRPSTAYHGGTPAKASSKVASGHRYKKPATTTPPPPPPPPPPKKKIGLAYVQKESFREGLDLAAVNFKTDHEVTGNEHYLPPPPQAPGGGKGGPPHHRYDSGGPGGY